MNTPQHFLVQNRKPTFDILHGNNALENIRETMEIARQKLAAGKGSVLYVNMLTSVAELELECADLLRDRPDGGQLLVAHYFEANLVKKIEFLTYVIPQRGVKTVIINSLEFAVATSRHRSELVMWIRKLRDEHGIHVILAMMSPPASTGLQSTLRFMANSSTQVGEYLKAGGAQASILESLEYVRGEAVVREMTPPASELPITEADVTQAPRPKASGAQILVQKPRESSSIITPEGALLKNNELASAFVSHA